nr:substrate-binding domain-containing protein [Rhodococcus erythropolis]
MAQGLVGYRTGTLGVVVRDVTRPIYSHLQSALQVHASARGMRVVATSGSDTFDIDQERRAMHTLVSLRVEGLIVCSGVLPVDEVAPFVDRIPTVIAGRPERHPLISSVFADEKSGAGDLVNHLVDLGHRYVGVLLWPKALSIPQHERGVFMIELLRARGSVIEIVEVDRDFDRESVVSHLLDTGVTAIMCPSDTQAVEILDSLRVRGVPVPQTMSVTGYDGFGPLATPLIGLTTIRQDVDGIAARAVEIVLRKDPTSTSSPDVVHDMVAGSLVVGRTSAPPGHTNR